MGMFPYFKKGWDTHIQKNLVCWIEESVEGGTPIVTRQLSVGIVLILLSILQIAALIQLG